MLKRINNLSLLLIRRHLVNLLYLSMVSYFFSWVSVWGCGWGVGVVWVWVWVCRCVGVGVRVGVGVGVGAPGHVKKVP